MSDSQFSNLISWIGECIGSALAFVGSGFDSMSRIHWFGLMIVTVILGFYCLRGLGANQRI